jgi:hypothetical protein
MQNQPNLVVCSNPPNASVPSPSVREEEDHDEVNVAPEIEQGTVRYSTKDDNDSTSIFSMVHHRTAPSHCPLGEKRGGEGNHT